MAFSQAELWKVERQVLIEELTKYGPQLGAKLKPRLEAELGRRLALPPQEWRRTIPRLSNLLAAHSDLVEVHRPVGPGDITVGLRTAEQAGATPDTLVSAAWYLPQVWVAFVNSDPRRRRFFHRQSREVVHFLDPSSTPPNPELAARVAADTSFVGIPFASAEVQSRWLNEFLETSPLIPTAKRELAAHFAGLDFTSSVNNLFTAALGQNAEAWRSFRAHKINDLIAKWAATNGIDLSELKPTERSIVGKEEPRSAPMHDLAKAPRDVRSILRELAESMDETELRSVLVPLSALERILRSGT